jgi:hypothetical protein
MIVEIIVSQRYLYSEAQRTNIFTCWNITHSSSLNVAWKCRIEHVTTFSEHVNILYLYNIRKFVLSCWQAKTIVFQPGVKTITKDVDSNQSGELS